MLYTIKFKESFLYIEATIEDDLDDKLIGKIQNKVLQRICI